MWYEIFYRDPDFVRSIQVILELLGTLAFALSGIRHAAEKKYDWFGGFVCGFSVAIGGGTLRDLMLGVTPFWMTSPFYVVCTMLAQVIVIVFAKYMKRLDNTWLLFDTIGLALFTIAGIEQSLTCAQPFWVAIIMGCITGCAGGIIRDVLLNKPPVVFQKEIYAMASVAGGLLYWFMVWLELNFAVTVVVTFIAIITIRFLALRYHISLPVLQSEE